MASTSEIERTVVSKLEELGIDYEMFEIDPDFADTAAFCEKYGFSLDDSGNTIIVASKRPKGKFSACVVKASNRLDVNKTVRQQMGVSRASFASAEETMELTGMMIGGVTPFTLPPEVPVYLDETLKASEYVILGSGSRSSKVKISPDDLLKIPNSQFIEGLALDTA